MIAFKKSRNAAPSMAVVRICNISRRAGYVGRGGVAKQYKGEHPIFYNAAGVGTRRSLFLSDDVGRVQVLRMRFPTYGLVNTKFAPSFAFGCKLCFL
jgi:hypothetical protein